MSTRRPEPTRGQWVLRAVAAVGPVAAVLASQPAGAEPAAWFLVLVGLVSVGGAAWSSSLCGPGALLLVLVWWSVRVEDGTSGWVLAAAVLMVAAHAATVVADHGPPALGVDPALVRLWLTRALLTLLAAAGAWAVTRVVAPALAARSASPAVWATSVAAVAVAVLTAAVLLTRESAR